MVIFHSYVSLPEGKSHFQLLESPLELHPTPTLRRIRKPRGERKPARCHDPRYSVTPW